MEDAHRSLKAQRGPLNEAQASMKRLMVIISAEEPNDITTQHKGTMTAAVVPNDSDSESEADNGQPQDPNGINGFAQRCSAKFRPKFIPPLPLPGYIDHQ